MLFEYLKKDASQSTTLILQAYPSRGVQKNMQKAWNFTKNKLRHRCFENSLSKTFPTNMLDNGTGQILYIVVLIVGLALDN